MSAMPSPRRSLIAPPGRLMHTVTGPGAMVLDRRADALMASWNMTVARLGEPARRVEAAVMRAEFAEGFAANGWTFTKAWHAVDVAATVSAAYPQFTDDDAYPVEELALSVLTWANALTPRQPDTASEWVGGVGFQWVQALCALTLTVEPGLGGPDVLSFTLTSGLAVVDGCLVSDPSRVADMIGDYTAAAGNLGILAYLSGLSIAETFEAAGAGAGLDEQALRVMAGLRGVRVLP
jgi:hypothetical protein